MKIFLISPVLAVILFGWSLSLKKVSQNNLNGSDQDLSSSSIHVQQNKQSTLNLIPFPQKVRWFSGSSSITSVKIDNPQALGDYQVNAVVNLANEYGLDLSPSAKTTLYHNEDKSIPNEGYSLIVNDQAITISSSSNAGTFYGIQTLRQLIEHDRTIRNCEIIDYPKHQIRGYMLDVGRNFQQLETLKQQLNIMAFYKLNTFHWHLTDRPAWRIESKKYSELTEAKNHRVSRDPGMFYSYEDIQELIQYANRLHINIIPEIDMPGHSDSFVTAMGVTMHSQKGMAILKDVLIEFFNEIPVDLCPIIHLGSDEVRIPNPEEFITEMVAICEAHDRKVMIWNPGLPANKNVIRQTWQAKHLEKGNYREVDSWNNYVNNDDPHNIISKLFFKPIGHGSENEVIGSILCLWPDVNLDNAEDAFKINPIYPALITHAQSCWSAKITTPYPDYLTQLPKHGTPALDQFSVFEETLLEHKDRYFKDQPFPYFKQTDKKWTLRLVSKSDGLKIEATGNTLIFKDRFKLGGYFPKAELGDVAIAETQIYSEKDKTIDVLIGFETPLRANRVYSGIPQNGSWDANGGQVFINGEEFKGPIWDKPGWKPSHSSGWGSKIDQEIPWSAEELYWTRNPAKIMLQKGNNTIRFVVPYVNEYQNWMISFVQLK